MQTAVSTAGTMTASVALTDSSTTTFFTPLTVLFTLNTPPISTSVADLIPTAMTHVTSTQCPTPAGFSAIYNLASA